MSLGTLTYLLAFAGIVVPIVIHLWSRQTPRTVGFGSLRFLRESETRTMRSVRPSELLLLLLRIVLLAVLALILAEPWSEKPERIGEAVTLVDPTYRDRSEVILLRDTADAETTRWLSEGFPSISEEHRDNGRQDLWQLADDAAALPFERLILLSPRAYDQFGPLARTVRKPTQWQSLPRTALSQTVDTLTSQFGPELVSLRVNGNASFDLKASPGLDADTLSVSVFFEVDEKYGSLASLLRAAFSAITQEGRLHVREVARMEDAQWLIWLRDGSPPRRARLLFANPMEANLSPITKSVYQIGTPLTAKDFIVHHLPLRLETLLTESHEELPSLDPRPVPLPQLQAFDGDPRTAESYAARHSWSPNLWLLLVVLLLMERWWSLKTTTP